LQEIIPLSAGAALLVTLLMIAVVTAINIWGTRKSSDVQNVTTIIKAGIIVVLGSVLLMLGFAKGTHAGEIPAALGTSQTGYALFSGIGFAMITVLWAYEGWQFGTYSAGEVVHPQRNFPRTFFLAGTGVSRTKRSHCGHVCTRRPRTMGGKTGGGNNPDFYVQFYEQCDAYRSARILCDGQRQTLFQ
jgi:APA family basic amino acid/polyamine antiporter